MNQTFEEGNLLSVELPGSQGATFAVLACVLHVKEVAAGQWALGCNFVNELTHDDMVALGVKRERATPDDPRNWVRFPADVRATCQALGDENAHSLEAQVSNLSASGLALLVAEAIEAGTLLNLELKGPHGQPLPMLACVVHVSSQSPGQWVLGCNFIRELSELDLQALL